MKITHVSYERLDLKLAEPYTIAYETVTKAVNFILKVETDTTLVGYGCAAPDKEVTLETIQEVETHINEVIVPYLKGKNPFTLTKILEELSQFLAKKASALAMVDMALLDIAAKKMKVPLYQYLGGYRSSIATSITIGILPIDHTLQKAKEYLHRGFKHIKLKGGLNVEEDIEKILKIHHSHPELILRFDANQGYDFEDAIKFCRATHDIPIEIFEQPSAVGKSEVLKSIAAAVKFPVMADESIKTLEDVHRLVKKEAIDMVNIKLMKVGGIVEGMHINSVARSAGLEAMVGCLDECALGISAGLHFALSRPNIHFADLDGHLDFLNDPFNDMIHLKRGILFPTQTYGLGYKG